MFTLDSDILAILLAIISFVIPAINAIREKKKKPKSQEQTQSDPFHFVEEEQEPSRTVVEESPDKSLSNEVEDLFSELLGLQHKEDQQLQEEPEELPEQEHNPVKQEPQIQETAVEEPYQEGIQVTVNTMQQENSSEPEENAKSVKERIKTNPKDMVLFAEILKPKFKEFEN